MEISFLTVLLPKAAPHGSASSPLEDLKGTLADVNGILPEMNGAIPVTLEMKPGDMVLLITDGFFELQNAKEEHFGPERLAVIARKVIALGRYVPASLYQRK